MTLLRVGLVMAIVDGEPRANLTDATALIKAAPAADVHLLPKLSATGYAHARCRESAASETPTVCSAVQRVSAAGGGWIGGSLISLDDRRRLTNLLWLFAPDGRPPVTDDKPGGPQHSGGPALFAPDGAAMVRAGADDDVAVGAADRSGGGIACARRSPRTAPRGTRLVNLKTPAPGSRLAQPSRREVCR